MFSIVFQIYYVYKPWQHVDTTSQPSQVLASGCSQPRCTCVSKQLQIMSFACVVQGCGSYRNSGVKDLCANLPEGMCYSILLSLSLYLDALYLCLELSHSRPLLSSLGQSYVIIITDNASDYICSRRFLSSFSHLCHGWFQGSYKLNPYLVVPNSQP